MKKLTILTVFLITAVINSAHAGNDNQKQAKKAVNTQQLSSVSIFKKDISPEKAMEYRKEYRSKDWLVNNDVGTYSFSNIPEFYLTNTVYRGAGQVAILEKDIDKSLLGFMTDTEIGKIPLKDLINNKQARMQGVLVIHDGKIVLEEYPGMRELDKHCWFSASKQLMGLTVHILEEEGVLDLEQTVNHYIPEYDGEDWKKVKVKHGAEDVLP